MSESSKKLRELLPIWAELTGAIIKLVCKVLLEFEERKR